MIRACEHCGARNRVPASRLMDTGRCGSCRESLEPPAVPLDVNEVEFDEALAGARVPILVDFWADWCAPCKAMAPIYEKAAEALEPNCRFLKLDTEAQPEIAARYNIRAIPTLMVFHKGKIIGQRAGAIDRRTLEAWLGSLFAAA